MKQLYVRDHFQLIVVKVQYAKIYHVEVNTENFCFYV